MPSFPARRTSDLNALLRFCHLPLPREHETHAFILVEPPQRPGGRHGNPSSHPRGQDVSFESRAARNLAVLCRRCPPTLRSDFPRHCVGCWASTSHAAPIVIVQGDRRMRRHPAAQRHDPARPKSLEWRTAPRRAARTAGPRRHPSSHRARLPARLAGVRPFEGSRAPVLR